ncbi:multidrug transporter [Pseudomonas corrugata]|uniref:Multidrug transporter n=1 Tax=Pseudomonas corrugata TaxID=47879 RepID=A0A3M3EYF0_9PSED|nr:hypothetical protein [Pseudomonas corrugata]AOE62775.1 multidrug transporter [Pseudomonas corrugata]MDU9026107.1 multidrug transporter [Pseudomonas corrugata]MDU9032650.1 multidrug transporter [Pseudomonas corrugata]MDU9039912.1 multidrug transporter [Pseudomonas corrugata]QTH14010.1 multidrug transporter [Pseudomonas corrugata]
MRLLRPVVLTLLLTMSLATLANTGSGDPRYTIQNPPAFAMIGDLLIARPLLLAATVIGAGAFVVSLPFTALGGGVGDAGKALVVDPAKATFVRCLGCVGEGFEQQE